MLWLCCICYTGARNLKSGVLSGVVAQWGLFLSQLLSKAKRTCVGLVRLVWYAKVLTDLAPCKE